jgi:hypothetical protein
MPTIHQLRRRAHYLAHMPRRGTSLRARVPAWWERSHADPEKRAFRRIGVISFGVVGGSVVLAKISQDAPAAGPIRAFAVAMFGLGAITMLGVVVLMGEEMVDAMDASDPMRASHGGAYGPRLKRYFREAGHGARTWFTSLPANVAALRHGLTRESLARFVAASGTVLRGIPPAGVPPPRSAGRLARPKRQPPPDETPASPTEPASTQPEPARLGRRAPATARSSRSGSPVAARRPIKVRSSRTPRPAGRSERAAPRAGRGSNTGGRSTR